MDLWEKIRSQKNFQSLDYEKQLLVGENFFKQEIAESEAFKSLKTDEERNKVYKNFMATLKPTEDLAKQQIANRKKPTFHTGFVMPAVKSVGEAAVAAATMPVGLIVGGGQFVTEGVGHAALAGIDLLQGRKTTPAAQTLADMSERALGTVEKLTYMPKSKGGQAIVETALLPFENLAEAGHRKQSEYYDKADIAQMNGWGNIADNLRAKGFLVGYGSEALPLLLPFLFRGGIGISRQVKTAYNRLPHRTKIVLSETQRNIKADMDAGKLSNAQIKEAWKNPENREAILNKYVRTQQTPEQATVIEQVFQKKKAAKPAESVQESIIIDKTGQKKVVTGQKGKGQRQLSEAELKAYHDEAVKSHDAKARKLNNLDPNPTIKQGVVEPVGVDMLRKRGITELTSEQVPSQYRVAIKDNKGNIIKGKKGETHGQQIERLLKEGKDVAWGNETGFVDTKGQYIKQAQSPKVAKILEAQEGAGVLTADKLANLDARVAKIKVNINRLKAEAETNPKLVETNIKKIEALMNEAYEIQRKVIDAKKKAAPPAATLDVLGLQSIWEKAAKLVSSKTSKFLSLFRTKPELKPALQKGLESMIEHDRAIRNVEFMAKELTKIVNDFQPDKNRQMLMVHAYEHKMRGKYWEQLTEPEKKMVKWAAAEKQKLNDFIEENKILTMMHDKKINHIYHHWIDAKTGEAYKAFYGKFSKGLPQSKQREIPTYEVGIEKGLKPATTNIGELIGLEWIAATRANSARALIKNLYGIKGDPNTSIQLRFNKEPVPIRMVERWDMLVKQGLTEGYKRYTNSALDKAMAFKTADGKVVIFKGAVGIREELYPFVRSYIESPSYGKLSQLNFVSKSMKLGMSFFHIVSLGVQELANMRVPFTHIPEGLRMIKDLTPEVKILHREGLELWKGYEDLGYKNKFFEGTGLVSKTGNVVTAPVRLMRDFIFDIVQPGMKTSFAVMQFNKLLPKYLKQYSPGHSVESVMAAIKQNKKLPEGALKCAREVVQKSDGHFSGEHYKRSLLETNRFMVKAFFTPEARKLWQWLLLSFTWQREHLLVAKNVFKSFLPDAAIKKMGLAEMGAIKGQYRKYLLGGLMIVGAVDLFNQMTTYEMDGEAKHIWQNPRGKRLAVRAWWNEPDYFTTDKDGTVRFVQGRPAYIRPIKSLFEVAEWANDPTSKFFYKVAPIISAIMNLRDTQFPQGRSGFEKTKDFLFDVYTPIVLSQAGEVTKGKKDWKGAALSFFGMPTSKDPNRRTVDALIGKYLSTKTKKDYDNLKAYIDKMPSDNIKRNMIKKYRNEVLIINEKDKDFWREALKARPEKRARMLYDRWSKMPVNEEAREKELAQQLESFLTDKTIEEFIKIANKM